MFGSAILETAIGVIFVLLLVSVICTAIREGIESFLKSRAAFLEQGIRELLHDRGAVGLARTFYNHPLIYSLYEDNYKPNARTERPGALARGGALPTYIPTRNFALALMDIAARGPTNAVGASDGSSPVLSLAGIRANVINLENAAVQRVLLTAVDTAQGDLNRAVANLAAWFDSGMDRVSGAYKRATHKVLFGIGLFIAIALNINPLDIADYLYHDQPARAAVVARAEAAARDSGWIKDDTASTPKRYIAARAELDSLRLPIGWAGKRFLWLGDPVRAVVKDSKGVPHLVEVEASPWKDFFSPLIGWLITALAATLGAPFWFDLLNKMMVVRSTVKPHEKSGEESSEDRQSRAAKAAAAANDVGSGATAVGAATGSVSPAQSASATATTPTTSPPDPEAHIDGCDVEVEKGKMTPDEKLPVAQGGVD